MRSHAVDDKPAFNWKFAAFAWILGSVVFTTVFLQLVLGPGHKPSDHLAVWMSPVDSFTEFASTLFNEWQIKYPNVDIRDRKADVRKTDSLKAPYIGTLSFNVIDRQIHSVDDTKITIQAPLRVTIECAPHITAMGLYGHGNDGKYWTVQKSVFTYGQWAPVRSSPSDIEEELCRKMNREGPLVTIDETPDDSAVRSNLSVISQKLQSR